MNRILFYTILLIILLQISLPVALLYFIYLTVYLIPSTIPHVEETFLVTEQPDSERIMKLPMESVDTVVKLCANIPSRQGNGNFTSFVSSKLAWDNRMTKTAEQEQVHKYLYGYLIGQYDSAIESIFELLLSFYPLNRANLSKTDTRPDDIQAKCERIYKYLLFPRLLCHRSYHYDTTTVKPYTIKVGIMSDPAGNKVDDALYLKTKGELRSHPKFTVYQRIITDTALCSSVNSVTLEMKPVDEIKPEEYKLCDPITDTVIAYKGKLFNEDGNRGIGYHPKTDGELFDYMRRFVFQPATQDTEDNRKKMKSIKCMFLDKNYSQYIETVIDLVWTIKTYLYDNRVDENDNMYLEYCHILVDLYTLYDYKAGDSRVLLKCDAK